MGRHSKRVCRSVELHSQSPYKQVHSPYKLVEVLTQEQVERNHQPSIDLATAEELEAYVAHRKEDITSGVTG